MIYRELHGELTGSTYDDILEQAKRVSAKYFQVHVENVKVALFDSRVNVDYYYDIAGNTKEIGMDFTAKFTGVYRGD